MPSPTRRLATRSSAACPGAPGTSPRVRKRPAGGGAARIDDCANCISSLYTARRCCRHSVIPEPVRMKKRITCAPQANAFGGAHATAYCGACGSSVLPGMQCPRNEDSGPGLAVS